MIWTLWATSDYCERAGDSQESLADSKEMIFAMAKHLSEISLNIILNLFNKVWESGKLPADWKHVPITKPGKDHT